MLRVVEVVSKVVPELDTHFENLCFQAAASVVYYAAARIFLFRKVHQIFFFLENLVVWDCGKVHQILLGVLLRQYLYFCASKASKLSTCMPCIKAGASASCSTIPRCVLKSVVRKRARRCTCMRQHASAHVSIRQQMRQQMRLEERGQEESETVHLQALIEP